MAVTRTYDLEAFVSEVRKLMAKVSDPVEQGKAVEKLLPKLLESHDWIDKVADLKLGGKSTEQDVYHDPDYGFSVFVYTHPPGFSTGIHTHGPSWVLYGVYENRMKHNRFQLVTEGVKEGDPDVLTIEPAFQAKGTAISFFHGFGHQVLNESDRHSINVRVVSGKPDSVIPWGERLRS